MFNFVTQGFAGDQEKLPVQKMDLLARAGLLRRWLIVAALIIGIHMPLLIVQAKWLWGRAHYQFFPVILVAFVWLLYIRVPLIEFPLRRVFSVRILLCLLGSMVLFSYGIYLNSGLLGLISCVLTGWASVWYFGGACGARELQGPFLFLAMVVPLPLNLDLHLISSLQLNASEVASTALDLRGVRHSLSGVIIRTATESYMVKEACSGINSLFSAIALMLGFSIYVRHGLIRIFLILLTTVLWVVVANALRVFLVVYCDAKYDFPLEVGWRHDALGIFTYCFAVLMSMSSEQLFRFLLPVGSNSAAELRTEFIARFRFPVLDWLRNLMDSALPSRRLGLSFLVAICCVFVVSVGWISILRRTGSGGNVSPQEPISGSLHSFVKKESLPESIDGWVRRDFDQLIRGKGDPSGLHSTMWSYRGNGFNAVFSLDGYYPEWHDLAYCYAGVGWQILSAENGSVKDSDDSPVFHTKLQLIRNSGSHATVFFSCFDSVQTSVMPPAVSGSFLRAVQQRLFSSVVAANDSAILKLPIYQLQLFVEADREFLPHEEQAFLDFFRTQRDKLQPQLKVTP